MEPSEENQGIRFEGDQWKQSIPSFDDEPPKMVGWLMKYSGGSIQDKRSAEYVLLGLVVFIIIISIFVLVTSNSGPRSGRLPVGEYVPE